MDFSKAIESGDFFTALKLIEPFRRKQVAKVATRKINAIVTSILFAFFFIMTFCGIIAYFGDPEDIAVLNRIPMVMPIVTFFNNKFSGILGENSIWYFNTLLWIVTLYLIPAITSAIIGLILPCIYPVKSKIMPEYTTKEQQANKFKECLSFSGFYLDERAYSNVIATVVVALITMVLLIGIIATVGVDGTVLMGGAVMTVALYFLCKFMSLLSVKINKGVVNLCTKSTYKYNVYVSETDKYIKKLKDEEIRIAEKKGVKRRKENAAKKRKEKSS